MGRRFQRFIWLPPAALVAALAVLWLNDSGEVFERSGLLVGLNFFFAFPVSALIAIQAGRGFLIRGNIGLALLGCGAILWGTSGFVGGLLVSFGPNATVTCHNILVWLSAACHLLGVALSQRPRPPLAAPRLCLAALYGGAFVAVAAVAWAASRDLLPVFMVPGKGGTPLRQLVLASALCMFLAAAVMLYGQRRRAQSSFRYWYGHGLLLIVIGLAAIMIQTSPGTVVSWIGRIAQLLGSAYMLAASLAALRAAPAEEDRFAIVLEQTLGGLNDIMDMIGDGIVVHEFKRDIGSSRYIYANPAICHLLGYTAAEMSRLSATDIISAEDMPSVPGDIETIIRCGRLDHEKTMISKDGRATPVLINTRLFHRDGRDLLVSVVHDITEMKEARNAVERANSELERRVRERTAELLAANRELEGFTFATSHDLRGPLGRISSFSALLEQQYRHRLEGNGLLYLDFIRQNALRLDQLVDDLLNHARVAQQDLELQPVDIGGVVRAVLQDKADDILKAGAELRQELLPARVTGDPHAIQQALNNLLENALKYSARATPPMIEIGGKIEGDRYRLWVRDNGIGFDMAYHDKIFEMFRRLHTYNEYPGTGMGLALVKRAMERQRGKVWAQSEPGRGTVFFLELPAADAESARRLESA